MGDKGLFLGLLRGIIELFAEISLSKGSFAIPVSSSPSRSDLCLNDSPPPPPPPPPAPRS